MNLAEGMESLSEGDAKSYIELASNLIKSIKSA